MRILVAALCATALASIASAAFAGDREDIEVTRRCTAASEIKLKLSEEDGRIEVEVEVDQDRNGIRWQVVLRQNGARVFSGTRRTRGPSGSFELRRVLSDTAGPDRIVARATSPSGEVCRAAATW
jgi:hypothetical protein